MTDIDYAPGTVCWIDLGTADPDATQAFYSNLFGWTVEHTDPSGYRLCALDGDLVAAFGRAEDPGLPYWSTNISVDDIAAATQQFAAAGAEIVLPPSPAGPPGDYAVIRDPVGAPLSLWQPGTQTGMQRTGAPATFAEATLLTAEADRAGRFYQESLGWDLDPDTGHFRLGEQVVARVSNQPPPQSNPRSLWLVSFATDDLTSAARNAKLLGATDVDLDLGPGNATMRDPAGALFGLTRQRGS
jgi:predicted enzyme related to lactoylglutathione lyase